MPDIKENVNRAIMVSVSEAFTISSDNSAQPDDNEHQIDPVGTVGGRGGETERRTGGKAG